MDFQYIPVTHEIDTTDLYRQQQIRHRRAAKNARKRRTSVARMKRTLVFIVFALVLGVVLASSLLSTNALATGADQASDSYKYYKEVYVESGDTLWSIAEENTDGSMTEITDCISEICSINNLNRLETLKSGSYIIVPYYSGEYLD
ncbi:MAG: LysM peptidoglycan-binding domain-containing protein [Lachnospiraceae bacterium]|nr:LysM peptidoglycan-binding domain-containing protein [Lachnospiraceae bacterium]